jgi:hypothetical protein
MRKPRGIAPGHFCSLGYFRKGRVTLVGQNNVRIADFDLQRINLGATQDLRYKVEERKDTDHLWAVDYRQLKQSLG